MIDSSAKNGQIMTEQLRILNKKKKTRTQINELVASLLVRVFLYGELENFMNLSAFLLYFGKIAVNLKHIALLLERHHDYYWCG